jgi:NADP-dependent 3-hydroxy acid dehydrogenase YdfG
MARQLAQTHRTGVALVLAARNEALLTQVAVQCAVHGAQTLVVKSDVSDRREREVVMTAKGKLGRWLKLVAPGEVEAMALAALKDEAKQLGTPC